MKFTNVNTNLYKSFIALYQERNMTLASEKLLKSQPSLTHDLRSLEDQLGVKLFHTHPRGLNPTLHADEIYPIINEVFQSLRDVEIRAAGFGVDVPATLHVGFTSHFAMLYSINYVTEYKKQMPNVVFALSRTGRNTREKLLNFDIEVAIKLAEEGEDEKPDVRLGSVQLKKFAQSFYCSKQFAEKHNITGPIDAKRLRQLPCITRPGGIRTASILGEGFNQAIEISGSEIAFQFIKKGIGFGALVDDMVNRLHGDADLVRMDISDIKIPKLVYEILYTNRSLSKVGKDFLNHIIRSYKKNIWTWSLD